MLRLCLFPAAVLASALMVGCSEQPVPSEPGDASWPSFRTTNSPDGPGAVVFRSEGGGIGFADIIPNTEFSYSIGMTLEELAEACAQPEFPPPPPGPTFEQVVLRPGESIKRLFRAIGAPLLAWNLGVSPGEFCSVLPFAVGTAQFILTDNDLLFSGERANAVGFRIHGTATALEGGSAIASGRSST